MGGGNQRYSGPPQPPWSRLPPRQGPLDQAYFGEYPPPGQHLGGNSDNPSWGYTGGGYYNPYFSSVPQGFQHGGWQVSGNTSSYMPRPQRVPYRGTNGYQGGNGPDPGIQVYDNVVTGDPRTVMIGEGNHARGQVRGRISGNCIFRS